METDFQRGEVGRLPDRHATFGHGTGHTQDGQEDRGGEITTRPCPVIILGGFLGTPSIYEEMESTIREITGGPVICVAVSRLEWAAAVSRRGWERILIKLHDVVQEVMKREQGLRVTLVGHSSGGVMCRLYLSPEPFMGRRFAGMERVEHLITLGSPHRNVRGARLRRWVDCTYPGAFYAPQVAYTAVAGRAVRGNRYGNAKERLAHLIYRQLTGHGDEWGDGIVPLGSAELKGARNLVLDSVAHAPVRRNRWYGSAKVVREWWHKSQPNCQLRERGT